jgi:hypothetical protein
LNDTTVRETIGPSGESYEKGESFDKLRVLATQAMNDEIGRLTADDRVRRSALRKDLRNVCGEAKRAKLRAEQLVIFIKQIWLGLPESRSRVGPANAQDVLNHIITMALDEFYRPDKISD